MGATTAQIVEGKFKFSEWIGQPKREHTSSAQKPRSQGCENFIFEDRKIYFWDENSIFWGTAPRQRKRRHRRAPGQFPQTTPAKLRRVRPPRRPRHAACRTEEPPPKPLRRVTDQPLGKKRKQRDVSDWTEKVDLEGFDRKLGKSLGRPKYESILSFSVKDSYLGYIWDQYLRRFWDFQGIIAIPANYSKTLIGKHAKCVDRTFLLALEEPMQCNLFPVVIFFP